MPNYFAKNLKFLREKNGYDQQKLADKLKIPRSTLSCWENNLRTPKIEQIQDIANFFNVNMDIISRDFSTNCVILDNKPITIEEFDELWKNYIGEKAYINQQNKNEISIIAPKNILLFPEKDMFGLISYENDADTDEDILLNISLQDILYNILIDKNIIESGKRIKKDELKDIKIYLIENLEEINNLIRDKFYKSAKNIKFNKSKILYNSQSNKLIEAKIKKEIDKKLDN